MEDYYNDGFNEGYGRGYRNQGHEAPQSDGDRYSYRTVRDEARTAASQIKCATG